MRWGTEKKGLCHLVTRRDAYAAKHPGAPNGAQTVERMAETIVKGKVTEIVQKSGHTNIAIERDGFRALLTRDAPTENHWVLSGYEIDENARGYRKKE